MCVQQSYQTVKTGVETTIVEKKSKFIGWAAHAETEEEALAFLQKIKKAHPQATHHVYAYILREGNRMRYSDDGEPQKTAGLPALEVLKGYPVTDTVVVVVRYFGGTLLGTGGLVRAYTLSAQEALKQAEIATVSPCVTLSVTIPYALRDTAVLQIEQQGGKNIDIQYTDQVFLQWTMIDGTQENLLATLQELTKGILVTVSDVFFAPF